MVYSFSGAVARIFPRFDTVSFPVGDLDGFGSAEGMVSLPNHALCRAL